MGTGKNPLKGAKVELKKGEGAIATVVADDKGNFKFEKVPEGEYDVVASGETNRGFYNGKIPGVKPTAAPFDPPLKVTTPNRGKLD